jgi:hypothetical protein
MTDGNSQLIYVSSVIKEPLVLDPTKIRFSPNPNPQLIKYGFNNLSNSLDLVSIISNPYWVYGLRTNFADDFETTDQIKKNFGIKHFDRTTAIMWEILNLFDMIQDKSTISLSANSDISKNNTASLVAMFKKQYNFNVKFDLDDQKGNSDLLFILTSSSADLEENAALIMVVKELMSSKRTIKKGSNLVLQLFSTQTSATAELIAYLSSLFSTTYLIKPYSSNDLVDSKYLVFVDAKVDTTVPSVKIPAKSYVQSFGFGASANIVSMDIVNMIQCSNSIVIPNKYHTYTKIRSYLKTEVYEGATYQELRSNQVANDEFWLKTFTDKNLIQTQFTSSINLTNKRCTKYGMLAETLSN